MERGRACATGGAVSARVCVCVYAQVCIYAYAYDCESGCREGRGGRPAVAGCCADHVLVGLAMEEFLPCIFVFEST
jgi:hypothetical protein